MRRRTRIGLSVLLVAAGAALAAMAWLRFATFHNETFDLAFYTRMAWGMPRGSFWEPIVGAHVFGLHVSPIIVPLGLVGMLSGGTAEVLLVAQAASIAAAAWPLARMGFRRFGELGAVIAALLWLLYPTIGHVGTFEMHPGTLAVLPLAWAIEAYDDNDAKRFVLAVFGVLLCREDLALVTGILAIVAWRSRPAERAGLDAPSTSARTASLRRAGRSMAILSFAWIALFVLVLHPMLAPTHGSVQLHFGKWGPTLSSAVVGMLSHPTEVLAHLAEPARATYLIRLLAPLAFLPLLAPRLLLPVVPLVAINLMSEWPTTTALDSHYQITALPFLVAAALVGAERLVAMRGLKKRGTSRMVLGAVLVAVAVAHGLVGGTPLSLDYQVSAFRADARTRGARRTVAAISPDPAVSVQAPYALMPHLAERTRFGPAPPPDRDTDIVVLDTWYRDVHAHSENVLRTLEEPTVRDWLARVDYGVVGVATPYITLGRGADTRAGIVGRRYLRGSADPDGGITLSACLALRGARRHDADLVLDLVAREPCPADVALRIGTGHRPRRVDLLFDGLLSPTLLRRGDRVRSIHTLTDVEWARTADAPLRVGLLRSSGARPAHGDPVAVDVDLD